MQKNDIFRSRHPLNITLLVFLIPILSHTFCFEFHDGSSDLTTTVLSNHYNSPDTNDPKAKSLVVKSGATEPKNGALKKSVFGDIVFYLLPTQNSCFKSREKMMERFSLREGTEQARPIEEKDFENEGLDEKSSGRKDKGRKRKKNEEKRMKKKE